MDDAPASEPPIVERTVPPKSARALLLILVVLLCAGTLLPVGAWWLFKGTEVGRKTAAMHGMELFTNPVVAFSLAWIAVVVVVRAAFVVRAPRWFWLLWAILLGVGLLNLGGCSAVWNDGVKGIRLN